MGAPIRCLRLPCVRRRRIEGGNKSRLQPAKGRAQRTTVCCTAVLVEACRSAGLVREGRPSIGDVGLYDPVPAASTAGRKYIR